VAEGSGGGEGGDTMPADVMGVPALPPARLTGLVERLRAAVQRLHRRMAPPPVRVLEGLFGALDHAALCALCRLDMPDRLDGPSTVDELAERVHADPELVRRLSAYAGARGWVDVDRRGRVRPNRTTRFLRRDHPGGWRAWVDFAGGPEVTGALGRLVDDPRTPDAFAGANGASFFEWYLAHPDRHAAFDAAMAAGGRLHGLALSAAVDWPSGSRVCDVGGGTGALLRVLVERHPGLRGVLFDLPAVVARAPHHERIDAVGGDAFAALPPGCDTYLFVNVLHDWDDDAAARMLHHVASTGGGGARAVVVEGERRPRPRDGITARTDLLMLALAPGGRERTTGELAGLAERAGLTLRRSVRLVSGDRAHVMS
jgi:C-methyltransferase